MPIKILFKSEGKDSTALVDKINELVEIVNTQQIQINYQKKIIEEMRTKLLTKPDHRFRLFERESEQMKTPSEKMTDPNVSPVEWPEMEQ